MQQIPDNWHQEFFGGLWLDVQANSFSKEESDEILEAVCEILQLPEGAKILDAPAGDGRISLDLARRGFELTGLERDPRMLERARTADAEQKVNWLQQDMWSMDAGADFDAALCLWTSLGYGSREQDQQFFNSIGASLKSGGLFLFETHVYETLLTDFEPRVWRRAGDVLVTEDREFDVEEARLYTDWTFSRQGEMEERQSAMQIYTNREMDGMLRAAGMETIASWGSWELDAFELGAPILIQLARKA